MVKSKEPTTPDGEQNPLEELLKRVADLERDFAQSKSQMKQLEQRLLAYEEVRQEEGKKEEVKVSPVVPGGRYFVDGKFVDANGKEIKE